MVGRTRRRYVLSPPGTFDICTIACIYVCFAAYMSFDIYVQLSAYMFVLQHICRSACMLRLQLKNVDDLFAVFSDTVFSFMKLKTSTFPNACLSRQHFWSIASWKRALTGVYNHNDNDNDLDLCYP